MDTQTGSVETHPPEALPGSATAAPSSEPPKRRGRGRPFGSRTSVPPLAEQPVGAESGEAQEPQPKRRKRRSSQVDTEKMRKQILGVHQLVSKAVQHLTGDENLAKLVQLDDTEAGMLAEGYAQVAREFDIEVFGGKTGALLQLIGAAAMVYGPRLVVFRHYQESTSRRGPVTVDSTAEPAGNGAAAAH